MRWVLAILLMVAPLQAADIYVDTLQGTDEVACGAFPSAEACKTIQYAVNKAIDNDVLVIAAGTYVETNGAGAEYLLFDAGENAKDLTLRSQSGSNDVIINSAHATYLLIINGMVGGTLTLQNITLSGTKTALCYWAGASTTTPVTFTGCTLAQAGTGAANFVFSGGGTGTSRTVTLTNCTVSAASQYSMNLAPLNAVTFSGGSVTNTYAGAGTPVTNFYWASAAGGNLTLSGTSISTTKGYAVGCSTAGTAIKLEVVNCQINPAGGACGGGIEVDNYMSGVIRGNTIKHSTQTGLLLGVETVAPGDTNANPLGQFLVEGNTIIRTSTTETHNVLVALGADGSTGAAASVPVCPVELSGNVLNNGWYGMVIKCRAWAQHHNRIYADKALYLSGASGCLVQYNTARGMAKIKAGDPLEYALSIATNQAGYGSKYNSVTDNIFVADADCQDVMYESNDVAVINNRVDRNIYYHLGTFETQIDAVAKASLAEVQAAWAASQAGTIYAANDANSLVANPRLLTTLVTSPNYLRIPFGSPARGAAGASWADIGADQRKERRTVWEE